MVKELDLPYAKDGELFCLNSGFVINKSSPDGIFKYDIDEAALHVLIFSELFFELSIRLGYGIANIFPLFEFSW